MYVDEVVNNLAESYCEWCKRDGIPPEEKDISAFKDILYANLSGIFRDGLPTFVKLEGKYTGRVATINLSLSAGQCNISAWGETQRIPITDLANIPMPNIEPLNETLIGGGQFARIWVIEPEAELLAKKTLDACFETAQPE